MKLLQNRYYKRLAAVSVGLGGLLAATVAVAGGSYGYGGGGGYGYGGAGYSDCYDDDDGYDQYGAMHDDDDDYGYSKSYLREPTFIDRGDSLRSHLEIPYLSYERDVRVEIEADAEVEVECVHKGYYNRRYTRKIELDVDGAKWFSRHYIKGGELDVWIETEDTDEEDFYRDYGYVCRDGYRAYVRDVEFSSAKVDVQQYGRDVVTWLCSFDYDTNNGYVPRRNVHCATLY